MQKVSESSVRAEQGAIPAELDRWNWGAFLLNWIWGIGNSTFVALLMFVPLVGLIMPFVLGVKGSRWAWRNRRWDSAEHFRRVQRSWAIWGVVIWIGVVALYGGLFVGMFYYLDHSEAYRLAVSRLQDNPEAADVLGAPISAGIPTGGFSVSPTSGRAMFSFTAKGRKAAGQVTASAIKQNGVWSLKTLKLSVDGDSRVIDLLKDIKAMIGNARSAFG